MKGSSPPPFPARFWRVVFGLLWLSGVVAWAFADYLLHCAFRRRDSICALRARWLQRHCRVALGLFRLQLRVNGPIPEGGLLVSNHQSYLDILVLSSILPVVFVSKRELKFWPLIGWLAQLAGTLFVDRRCRTQVAETNREIQAALDAGLLVVLFPEGTTSDGTSVLPFRSALLEPAARRTHPLSVSCIEYAMDDGDAASEVCYWGDHVFFPHLLNLLKRRGFRAAVQFSPVISATTDRKELAGQLRVQILKLKANGIP
jgi:1-acyl-sn-glycerol-3-phosphate acyltransferase